MDSREQSGPRFGARTDVGGRRRNEDAVWPEGTGTLENTTAVVVVCDGMGGAIGGAVASEIATATIRHVFTTQSAAGASLEEALRIAFRAAHQAIVERGRREPALTDMGTTAVALAIDLGRREALFGHVGDSRGYEFRNNSLSQVTRDHSRVQELRDAGEISGDSGDDEHPRNEITRALGLDEPEVDLSQRIAVDGAAFLLSSDGLHGVLRRSTLQAALRYLRTDVVADVLIDVAKQSKTNDNCTAAVVRFVGEPEAEGFGEFYAATEVIQNRSFERLADADRNRNVAAPHIVSDRSEETQQRSRSRIAAPSVVTRVRRLSGRARWVLALILVGIAVVVALAIGDRRARLSGRTPNEQRAVEEVVPTYSRSADRVEPPVSQIRTGVDSTAASNSTVPTTHTTGPVTSGFQPPALVPTPPPSNVAVIEQAVDHVQQDAGLVTADSPVNVDSDRNRPSVTDPTSRPANAL